MTQPYITSAVRVRRTPFTNRVELAGVKAYSVYNHMLIPQVFRSTEEDYAHLKNAVQVWDVSVERQVQVKGPDALRLVQMTTPRDMSSMAADRCFYIPMVDDNGGILNDPIAIKIADDCYWLSIADTDMIYYCKGLAIGFGLDVTVTEPDVSPLAIQGPKANELVRRVFGDDIVATKFFRYKTINFQGKDMLIARSGWSHQGGFEIYLDGSEHGEAMWDMLFEAGEDLDVRPGCPNVIERIESGLLSIGNDLTMDDTPFEAGLGKYCNLEAATTCVGHAALTKKREPKRQIRPIAIDGPAVPSIRERWPVKDAGGKQVGHISSAVWSPDYNVNVAIGMIDDTSWDAGTGLTVHPPGGERTAQVQAQFWG